MPSPALRIATWMAIGLFIGAMLSVWSSWLTVVTTAVVTSLALGLAMVVKLAFEARRRRKARSMTRRPTY